jgi:hypothetical protein
MRLNRFGVLAAFLAEWFLRCPRFEGQTQYSQIFTP